MNRIRLFHFLFFLIPLVSYGQYDFETSKGMLRVTPVQHGSFVIEWDSLTYFFDPSGDVSLYEKFKSPAAVFISDVHGDHLNIKTLSGLDLIRTMFIVPKAVAQQLPSVYEDHVIIMNNGDTQDACRVSIKAIPMYNLPEDQDSRHPKGRGNGYVINFEEFRVYVSGDTEDIKEMRELQDIDLAFVCMNMPYTMTIEQAAEAVLEFKPKTVVPYHYRGKEGLADVKKFKELVSVNPEIKVMLWNWYLKEE